jgi:hypothetical protein
VPREERVDENITYPVSDTIWSKFLQMTIFCREYSALVFRRFARVAARLQLKGSDEHPSSTALVVIYLQITTFRSGADGIRTHALRRAKAAR